MVDMLNIKLTYVGSLDKSLFPDLSKEDIIRLIRETAREIDEEIFFSKLKKELPVGEDVFGWAVFGLFTKGMLVVLERENGWDFYFDGLFDLLELEEKKRALVLVKEVLKKMKKMEVK